MSTPRSRPVVDELSQDSDNEMSGPNTSGTRGGKSVLHHVERSASGRPIKSVNPLIRKGDPDGVLPTIVVLPSLYALVPALSPSVAPASQVPRTKSRRAITLEAVVTAPNGERYSFQTVNVSTRGLFLSAAARDLPLTRGMVCQVTLRGTHRSVDFSAEIVHVADTESESQRGGYGLQILTASRTQIGVLEKLIAETPTREEAARARRLRYFGRPLAAVLGLGLVTAGIIALYSSRHRLAVNTTKVQRASVNDVVRSANGEIVPRRFVTVRSNLPAASVLEVLVTPGMRVGADDVLARVINPHLEQARTQAEAKVAAAEARQRQAHDRNQEEHGAHDALVAADTALARARTDLQAREAETKRGEIRAPFGGFISDVEAHSGEIVSPGAALCEIVDASALHAAVPFSEGDAARLKAGMPAHVVTAGEQQFEGVVDAMGAVVRTFGKGKAVLVEVSLPKDSELRPGTTARAEITSGKHDGVVVPAAALTEGAHPTVYVVGAGSKLELREVTIGVTNGPVVEIVRGLHEGERVVSDAAGEGLAAGVRVDAK